MSKDSISKDRDKSSVPKAETPPKKESLVGCLAPLVESGIFSSSKEEKKVCEKVKFKWVC